MCVCVCVCVCVCDCDSVCVCVCISLVRKQLAFMLGRQQVVPSIDEGACADLEDLTDIISNVHLNTNFLNLAREVRGGEGREGGRGGRDARVPHTLAKLAICYCILHFGY